jgi:hypothetical protein
MNYLGGQFGEGEGVAFDQAKDRVPEPERVLAVVPAERCNPENHR